MELQMDVARLMGRVVGTVAVLLLMAQQAITAAHAEVQQKIGTFAGMQITYRVILPNNYDPGKAYPTILQFAGGPQTLQIVERSLEADWRANAEQRGYVVVSPAATDGQLYFEGGARIFPAFIDHILRNYRVAGGKLHITGQSNGGLSAFHIASLFPQYFISVTGAPGLLSISSSEKLAALKPLCIYMHVGDQDTSWRQSMQLQYSLLKERGVHVEFTVEKDQPHRLDVTKANLANRLFDELEASTHGCAKS
jgi:poly(3-hydroxybutyrate) depolymerase